MRRTEAGVVTAKVTTFDGEVRTSAAGVVNPRDYVGYGGKAPRPCWPNSARVAVPIVLNFEEGAEDEIDHIPASWPLTDSACDRHFSATSEFEYGARVGIWRLLRLFDRFGLPISVFGCGKALETNLTVTRALVDRGYEFVNHGYEWVGHSQLPEKTERRLLEIGTQALTHLTGVSPSGWYSKDGLSPNSRSLIREYGYIYDANSMSDDCPYDIVVEGESHVVVPYTGELNDYRIAGSSHLSTAQDFADCLTFALEQLIAESPTAAVMPIGLHPRLIGRPGYIVGLERFLLRFRDHPEVWFATYRDIVNRWMAARSVSDGSATYGE